MGGKTVLVVDDSQFSRMVTRRIIARFFPDWAVIEAGDGDAALAGTAAEGFDFALIDITMPGPDAFLVAQRLRERHPRANISMLTANVQGPVRAKAQAAGFGFIAKPVNEKTIVAFLKGREAT